MEKNALVVFKNFCYVNKCRLLIFKHLKKLLFFLQTNNNNELGDLCDKAYFK